MSYSGYSRELVNVGGGFLGVLIDLSGPGGKAYANNVHSLLPVILIFLILSGIGAMFGFISYSTAFFYSFVVLISLSLLSRLMRAIRKET